jgi:hypothetical protein
MPRIYNNIMGMETNHMVRPLPSGVINAPKIIINIKAYLKFFIQNLLSIRPVNDRIYIISGS